MIQVLRQYVEGDIQITEYTRDGVTVSHRLETPLSEPVQPGETLPVPQTLEQRVSMLENTIDQLLLGGK